MHYTQDPNYTLMKQRLKTACPAGLIREAHAMSLVRTTDLKLAVEILEAQEQRVAELEQQVGMLSMECSVRAMEESQMKAKIAALKDLILNP